MTLPLIERGAAYSTEGIVPARTSANAQFWDALKHGDLTVQFCNSCRAPRFPIGPICPHCGSGDHVWRVLSGEGTVFSWVRYHRSYIPEFEDLLPYSVVLVELAEGVRIFGRYLSSATPCVGDKVSTIIERWADGVCVPVFAPVGEKS